MSALRSQKTTEPPRARKASPGQKPHLLTQRSRTRVLAMTLQFGAIVVLALVWQIVVQAGAVNSTFTSKPTDIIAAFFHGFSDGSFTAPLVTTITETLLGFGISVGLGVLFSLLIYWVPVLHQATRALVAAANNLPRLALAPLFVLWFGIGTLSRVALVVSMAFFVILINTYAGLQHASRDHLLLARVLGAGRWKTFIAFVLPGAIPSIFAGFQLGLAFAFVGAVIGEMIMGGSGLGAQLVSFQSAYQTANVMALLVLMALVATVMSSAVHLLERRLLAWHEHEFRGVGRK